MSIETNEFRTEENPDHEQDETTETDERSELGDLPGRQPEQAWTGDETGAARTAEPGAFGEADETDGLDGSAAVHGLGESDELDEYPAAAGLEPSTGADITEPEETEESEWQAAGDADRLQDLDEVAAPEQLADVDQLHNVDGLQDADETEPEIETEPESAAPEGVARPEDLGGRGVGDSGQPLVGIDARDEFLSRWEQIQVSFVEDPAAAVEGAEVLTQEIGAAMLAAFEDRIGGFAAAGRAAADTEQRRLALRQYRAFIGVILP
jgi:hypothetical protein